MQSITRITAAAETRRQTPTHGGQPSGNLENRYACFDDFHNNFCNTDKLAPARISDRVSHGIAHADLEHLRTGTTLQRLKRQPQIFDMGALGLSAHALPVTVGHSGLAAGVTGWPACRRRQPVFGSRAGARADVRAPGPGCGRDGWRGCCGQHKATQVRVREGPTREQHGQNGIPRHTLARVLK